MPSLNSILFSIYITFSSYANAIQQNSINRNLLQLNRSSLNQLCVSFEDDSICSTTSNTANTIQSIGDTVLLYVYGWNKLNEQLYTEEYNIDISSDFIDSHIIVDSFDNYIVIIKIPNYINDTSNYLTIYDKYNISIYYDVYFTFINDECSNGYYDNGVICKYCEYSEYTLDNTQCKQCPKNAMCAGGDNIFIDKDFYSNYFMFNYNDNINNSNEFILATARCPVEYCCQNDVCNIMDVNATCALHRNASIPLCGGCENGFTELYGNSAECGICSNSSAILVILPGVIAFFIIISFIGQSLKVNYISNKIKQKMAIKQILLPFTIYTSTSFLYFYQMVTCVSLNNVIRITKPLSALFTNLSVMDGSCVFGSLNARTKLALPLIVPNLSVVVMLVIMFLVFKFYLKKKPRKGHNIVTDATFRIFSILYASIVFSFLKLSTCVAFDDYVVMKYAGAVACYDALHFFCLLLVIVLVIFLPIALQRIQRKQKSIIPPIVLGMYRNKCWWYPIFDLFRKGILITASMINFSDKTSNNIFVSCLCSLLLLFHLYILPFKYSINNHLETFILLLLLLISILNINPDLNILAAVLSICAFFPLPMLLFQFVKQRLPYHIVVNADNKSDNISDNDDEPRAPEYDTVKQTTKGPDPDFDIDDDKAFKILHIPGGKKITLYKKTDFNQSTDDNDDNDDNDGNDNNASDTYFKGRFGEEYDPKGYNNDKKSNNIEQQIDDQIEVELQKSTAK